MQKRLVDVGELETDESGHSIARSHQKVVEREERVRVRRIVIVVEIRVGHSGTQRCEALHYLHYSIKIKIVLIYSM